MRNLKRALSLALAGVMLMGMMVVGAGAASSDFTDADEIKNVEAVDVMVALGVLEGGDKGDFQPNSILTREQAAKIICYMLLGPENAEKLTTSGAVFSDVAADRWSAPFIGYCVNLGILAGDGQGNFFPEGKLTGAAFAKMLLVALGYDPAIEKYTGNEWTINVAGDAIESGIAPKGLVLTDELSRQDAAQMAFQTLTANMVKYQNKGTEIINSDGSKVVIGASAAEAVEVVGEGSNNYAGGVAGTVGLGYRQFCEKYFDDLSLLVGTSDAMNRTANQWTYKNKTVGTYAETPDYTVVIDKTQSAAKAIENISKSYTYTGSFVSVNGGAKSGASTSLKVGDVIEVYMSDTTANQVANIAVTRYLAAVELTGDVATKGEGDDLEVRVPGVFTGYKSADNVTGYAGLVKGDVVYYYTDKNGDYHLAKADSFDGELTGTKTGTPTKYIISGTEYVANDNIIVAGVTSSPVYNTAYTYYTDNNGYLIYAVEQEEGTSDYVVIQEIVYVAGDGSINGSSRVEARIVKMDGTTEVVTVASVNDGTNTYTGIDTTDRTNDATNADHKLAFDESTAASTVTVDVASTVTNLVDKAFFTYSVNSDNEYELTKVVANAADKITVGNDDNSGTPDIDITNGKAVVVDGNSPTPNTIITVNDSTVFVIAKETNGNKFNVYTGKNNVPDVTDAAIAWVAKDGIATYVYVDQYGSNTVSGDTVFFMDATKEGFSSEKQADGTTLYYNTYKAIVDGVSTTVKVKATSAGVDSLNGGSASVAVALFAPTYDANGIITKLVASNLDVTGANGYVVSNGTLVVNGTAGYSYGADAKAFIMDEDGNVTEAMVSDLTDDVNDTVYVVKTNTTDSVADYLFIVENDDSDVSLASLTVNVNSGGADAISAAELATLNSTGALTITDNTGNQPHVFAATANGVGAAVTYDNNGDGSFADGETSITSETQDAEDKSKTFKIKVVAADSTEKVYTITIKTPGSGT